ncbi:MAG: TerC/Alx family metal homeostasis membrane protein [Nocardioides sp.]
MLTTIATPQLWGFTIAAIVGLLVIDFLATRKPHEVSMREAVGWSLFYLALPIAFGAWVWRTHGSEIGLQYYAGYLVEKSLSVDNLFVFILLLGAFAVPRELRQRVLLYGIIGALLMRAVFIALGAAALSAFDWVFLVFGLVLVLTGLKLLRDALTGADHGPKLEEMRIVKLIRRFYPVTADYQGAKLTLREAGRRTLTPLALVVAAVLATDLVFAIDSVPAVYGITADPYLVFATNAFALLGLRALYFVLEGALSKLIYLGYGLSAILLLIGVKLALHWAHLVWPAVPEIPTLWSLVAVVGILAITTLASLLVGRRTPVAEPLG